MTEGRDSVLNTSTRSIIVGWWRRVSYDGAGCESPDEGRFADLSSPADSFLCSFAPRYYLIIQFAIAQLSSLLASTVSLRLVGHWTPLSPAIGKSQLEPPLAKMNTIWCLLEGKNDVFSVIIDEVRTVDHLKMEIKKEKSVDLAAVEANSVQLYHVNVAYDSSGDEEHIKQANEVFQDLIPLDALVELSTLEKGFPEGEIHILVQLPPSESIDPRAYGAIAETTL
jgi:hypothetical protein